MCAHFFKFPGSLYQLFVFKQLFYCTNEDDYDKVFEKIQTEFNNNWQQYQYNYWENFWETKGNEILQTYWKKKYGEFIDNKAENSNEETQNNSIQQELTVPTTEEAEAVTETSSWQELWDVHVRKTYELIYSLYNLIAYNFYIVFRNSISREHNTNGAEAIKDSTSSGGESEIYDIGLEFEQLELLGLPIAFGSNKMPKKHSRKVKKQQYKPGENLSIFYSDDDETYIECSDNEVDLLNQASMTSDTDDKQALQQVQTNAILKRKTLNKKHKLRHVPEFMLKEKNLLKYWQKRFSLFSRFDAGIRLDRESWFSVTPEKVAIHIAERLACDVLVDGFCGCGGNAIQFAKTCGRVIAIDIDPLKLEMAKHNARIYGVADKIEFVLGDFMQLSANSKLNADAVFLSPPWGGPKYKKSNQFDIECNLLPVGATALLDATKNISSNIAIFLPRNSNMKQIVKLAGVGKNCEVEYNYLDTRLVAITAIYGEDIVKTNDQ